MEKLESDKPAPSGQHTDNSGKLGYLALYACEEKINHTDTWRRDADADPDRAYAAETQLSIQPPANTEHVEAAVVRVNEKWCYLDASADPGSGFRAARCDAVRAGI